MKPSRLIAVTLAVVACVTTTRQLCHAQSYRNAVLADNPLVYLSFDELGGSNLANAGNLGATHDATTSNSPGLGWMGAIGNDPINRAIRLNGSTDFLTVNSAIAAANFSDADYTIEAWIKKDTSSGPRDIASLTNAAGSAHGVLVETNAAGQTFRYLHRSPLGGGGGENINPSAQTYTVDQWHHIAIVNDANAMRFYLDGNLDGVTNTSSNPLGVDLTTTIGRLSNTLANRYFDGFVDEVAIYDGALSQAQIQSHIDATTTLAAGDVARTSVLNVDFTGQSPAASVESGFQAFSRADGTTGDQSENYASPFAATGTDITVSVDDVAGFRNRNNMSGPDGDLGESFVFRNDSLVLTLSNLAAGEYELLTYHHDSTNTQANVDVLLTDANNAGATVATDILAGTGTSPSDIALASIGIVSDGLNDIVLEFAEAGTQPRPESVVVLSGFELNQVSAIPEPTTFAIWALLGVAGFAYWVRGKQSG